MAAEAGSGFERPLQIRPHPAWPVLLLLAVLYSGGAVCAWNTSLPLWLRLALVAGAAAGLYVSSRRYRRTAGLRLGLNPAERWFIINPAGDSCPVQPRDGLYILPDLALLTMVDEDAVVYPFIISPLNADADTRRRLRVRWRLRKDA